jgi:hypothetical protein
LSLLGIPAHALEERAAALEEQVSALYWDAASFPSTICEVKK